MDFVLALHSHLPYVLNHGRWPHGSDWLSEAALDTYLPLLEGLHGLDRDGVSAPVTIGFTPVLANQLRSPRFIEEVEAFFDQRLTACDEAPESLRSTGDAHLIPLVDFWRSHLVRLRQLFHSVDRDLVTAFRRLADRGRIEIIGGAATHGFLPLLGRDESIRLQLLVGRAEHRRLFGRDPVGCWLPECAYRPGGMWAPLPGGPTAARRPGIEEHLTAAGFRFFFTDAHLAAAGTALGWYGDAPLGAERFDLDLHGRIVTPGRGEAVRSPYRGYRVSAAQRSAPVFALVRDPHSSMQVWSRAQGYPGDGAYLEFHKIRWPGGLKYWRVTGSGVDLAAKEPYDPGRAREHATGHAGHFAQLLQQIVETRKEDSADVIVAPFDTELFGHWWFEGVDFLSGLYRALGGQSRVRPVTAGEYLDEQTPRAGVRLAAGSWGANGDYSMWLNPGTEWTWKRLWPLEDAFWDVAAASMESPAARTVLAQAARELLLTQSSDWQFIISTGAVADYAERRFNTHCDDANRLVDALTAHAAGASLESALNLTAELRIRDDVFPDILDSIDATLDQHLAATR